MFTGYIYKITNKNNGMVYIGKTINNPALRWSQHLNGSDSVLSKAICDEGVETFIFEVIDKCSTNMNDLDKMEELYIQKYDSFNSGYNNKAKHLRNNLETNESVDLSESILKLKDANLIDLLLWRNKLLLEHVWNPRSKYFQIINFEEDLWIQVKIKNKSTFIRTRDYSGIADLITDRAMYRDEFGKLKFPTYLKVKEIYGDVEFCSDEAKIAIRFLREIPDEEYEDVHNLVNYLTK